MRLALALLLVGCYSPSPHSGAYLCSTDGACPSSQHCLCGLCVNHDADAACGFTLGTSKNPSVSEHESFPVTITALQKGGGTASGFADTVTLSFVLPDGTRWCDVSPSTVQLSGGTATTMVTLNRETIPPQKPRLQAVFAGNSGQSDGIEVSAPQFVKDAAATVAPVTAGKSFGWSDTFVAEPSLLHDGSGFRMYFVGVQSKLGSRVSIGVATSTDGVSFAPQSMPVFTPDASSAWYSGAVEGPAAFFNGGVVALAFSGTMMSLNDITPPGELGVATSTDGLAAFAVGNNGQPVVKRTDCDYCNDSLDFPQVLDDPANPAVDGGTGGKLMFFSASQNKIPAIGRASSADGMTWVPEPAPVLAGDLGGEAVLLTPHVLVEGSVFKMWYSFAKLADAVAPGVSNCDVPTYVGYATSSDGFYWVRSPSNQKAPPIGPSTTGWDAGVVAFLTGTPLFVDDSHPEKGVVLYYTTLRHAVDGDMNSLCLPNGIGRATRM